MRSVFRPLNHIKSIRTNVSNRQFSSFDKRFLRSPAETRQVNNKSSRVKVDFGIYNNLVNHKYKDGSDEFLEREIITPHWPPKTAFPMKPVEPDGLTFFVYPAPKTAAIHDPRAPIMPRPELLEDHLYGPVWSFITKRLKAAGSDVFNGKALVEDIAVYNENDATWNVEKKIGSRHLELPPWKPLPGAETDPLDITPSSASLTITDHLKRPYIILKKEEALILLDSLPTIIEHMKSISNEYKNINPLTEHLEMRAWHPHERDELPDNNRLWRHKVRALYD